MNRVTACELSFIPMGNSGGSVPVHKVLGLIQDSGLAYESGAMSTLVRGPRHKVFELLEDIYVVMDTEYKFVMTTKISNACGC